MPRLLAKQGDLGPAGAAYNGRLGIRLDDGTDNN
jgi:hypothetical protein